MIVTVYITVDQWLPYVPESVEKPHVAFVCLTFERLQGCIRECMETILNSIVSDHCPNTVHTQVTFRIMRSIYRDRRSTSHNQSSNFQYSY